MDNNFTEKIKAWLDTPSGQRDLEAGNLMLLKLSNNKVGYRMIAANPPAFASHIEKQLKKYYDFRIWKLQHEAVAEMDRKVESIMEKTAGQPDKTAPATKEKPKGIREDHDSLPEHIRAKWEQNLDILYKMRKLHVELKKLSLTDSPCPDSERFPFLKEIIALDKKLHANWKAYDTFKAE